jgi:LytR cell envelope-related transcriptional attenuator
MNDAIAPDFFDRLELELRRAATRRPRRVPSAAAVALPVLLALALALVPLVVVLGGQDRGEGHGGQRHGGVNPAHVTVAVLNGTTVPGLASALGDELNAAGFRLGAISNFADQRVAESVVQYAPGHQLEAHAVGGRVGIDRREPIDASTRALTGDATVIVIVGADEAP